MNQDLLYQIALTLIPNIGPVQAKILLQLYEPKEIFGAKRYALENMEGIGTIRANNIKDFDDFKSAEKEIAFIEKHCITPLFLTDDKYPKRLLNCYDSPILLYYRGSADLNASKTVSVIGTRKNTDYGRQFTDKLISDLAALPVTVISGLAYGIDAIAHKASLKNKLPTIGVLAHGLDQVYPPANAVLAWEMVKSNGGLLTEYRNNTTPDRHNFPSRNRIVAGMSDATIVVETGIKGGSMITAELANSYNKDVFAVPGKITDHKSAGCNHLIKMNKAVLLTDAKELIELMGWEERVRSRERGVRSQRQLFIEMSDEEKVIVGILQEKDMTHIDEINLRSALSNGAVAAALLNLEMQNIILSKPGKFYSLC